jgi:hypothetical protein
MKRPSLAAWDGRRQYVATATLIVARLRVTSHHIGMEPFAELQCDAGGVSIAALAGGSFTT